MWSEPLEFGKLTWPEVARAAGEKRVPIVPIGTLEDHGRHLPIDTDVLLVEAVCRGAAERLPAETVLLPPIVPGYSPHHMDFPGTITIGWDTFCRYCTDVALSLVRHGFERVLLVNGHGSNQNLVETAARLAMVEEPGSLVAASFYLVSERGYPETGHAWMDWADGPLKLMPWWSSFSESGVQGDATRATAAKGEALFEAATEEIATYVSELRGLPLPRRKDHH